jgi:thioredoxin-related protein
MRIQINAARKTKYRHTVIAVIVLFFSIVTCTNNMLADDKKEPIYDPALDVKTAVKDSLDKAQKESKHILLMFGGNWCPWCHKLHQLLKSDKAIKKFLEENYILVMVDVGEKASKPLNRDLVDIYRVMTFLTVPFLFYSVPDFPVLQSVCQDIRNRAQIFQHRSR